MRTFLYETIIIQLEQQNKSPHCNNPLIYLMSVFSKAIHKCVINGSAHFLDITQPTGVLISP
jgi:hypothetical protein